LGFFILRFFAPLRLCVKGFFAPSSSRHGAKAQRNAKQDTPLSVY
jgi:hypothetical protein